MTGAELVDDLAKVLARPDAGRMLRLAREAHADLDPVALGLRDAEAASEAAHFASLRLQALIYALEGHVLDDGAGGRAVAGAASVEGDPERL